MFTSPRSRHAIIISGVGSLAALALAAGPAGAARETTAITGTDGSVRLAHQVPADYRKQGSVTVGGPQHGRYIANHPHENGRVCTTDMEITGLVRKRSRGPVRRGDAVRWPVARRTESLSRVDAAGRLAHGGSWRASGTSNIRTQDVFPTSEIDPYFRFGVADVRAPMRLPAGRIVLVRVIAKAGITRAPGPLSTPGDATADPTPAEKRQCRAYARKRLPADVRRVLCHLKVVDGDTGANP